MATALVTTFSAGTVHLGRPSRRFGSVVTECNGRTTAGMPGAEAGTTTPTCNRCRRLVAEQGGMAE